MQCIYKLKKNRSDFRSTRGHSDSSIYHVTSSTFQWRWWWRWQLRRRRRGGGNGGVWRGRQNTRTVIKWCGWWRHRCGRGTRRVDGARCVACTENVSLLWSGTDKMLSFYAPRMITSCVLLFSEQNKCLKRSLRVRIIRFQLTQDVLIDKLFQMDQTERYFSRGKI